MRGRVFLFGEAERGEFCTPVFCSTLVHLAEKLGAPPPESQGLFYAIQTLLFKLELIYFRVQQEGVFEEDYMCGLRLLQKEPPTFTAICMPGVSNPTITHPFASLCATRGALLLVSERDFYDLLTA